MGQEKTRKEDDQNLQKGEKEYLNEYGVCYPD